MRFITGFLIGLVIGLVTVMLITPQSGRDFQQGIRARFDEILAEGRKAATTRRAELEGRLTDLRAAD
jgi:gas vesicle protein